MDFTSDLIDAAKRYSSFHNIEYVNSDLLSPDPKYFSGSKNIVKYKALLHFFEEQLC
ncbi:hypothetical protein NTGM5_150051 [Candidatus Nitrotoga sp. M5]|nr:hypothetical protein NTGM5_150051 [Candidatus Nitrotoga sp. M5]